MVVGSCRWFERSLPISTLSLLFVAFGVGLCCETSEHTKSRATEQYDIPSGEAPQHISYKHHDRVLAFQSGGAGARHAAKVYRLSQGPLSLDPLFSIPDGEYPICLPKRDEVLIRKEASWNFYDGDGDILATIPADVPRPWTLTASADGRYVAGYSSWPKGESSFEPRIFVIDVEKRQLESGPVGYQPAFAPDSKHLYYVDVGQDQEVSWSRLYKINIDLKDPQVVETFRPALTLPTVSFDGSQIAGVQLPDAQGDHGGIVVYGLKSKVLKKLSTGSEICSPPLFAPQRPIVAYVRHEGKEPQDFAEALRLSPFRGTLIVSADSSREIVASNVLRGYGDYAWAVDAPVLVWLTVGLENRDKHVLKVSTFSDP